MVYISKKEKLKDVRNKDVGVRREGKKVKNNFNMRKTSINRIKERRSRNKFEKMVICAISMCH